MSKQTEAIKLAIEVFDGDWHDEIVDTDWADKANNAITVLREALAEQVQQEPVVDEKYEAIVEDLAGWGCYVEGDRARQSLEKHVREVLTVHGITKGNT